MPSVPRHVETLQPYVPGKPIEEVEREYGVSNVAKLASNENALGPSPRALAAAREACATVHLYPDGSAFFLRRALAAKLASNENALGPSPRALAAAREACAKVHLYPDGSAFFLRRALAAKLGVSMEEVAVGNGSNEMLELLVRTFLHEGDETLTAAGSFVVYRLATHAHGRTCVEVPMRERRYDLPALRDRLSPRTRIVFIANPDNPNGSHVGSGELVPFLESVPRDVMVVLDEAYVEFVTAPDFPDGLELRRRFPNVVVCRTFSKIYGLAGLRLGYLVASPEVVGYVDRVREPFNVNSVAQAAGLAALGDLEHVARSRALAESERPFLSQGLRALGATVWPSQTNFVLAELPGRAGRDLFEGLLRRGVVVRPIGGPSAIRVTVGLRSENEKLIAALGQVLAQ
jgi:histidinol-phosphate aminotransferase